MNEPYSVQPRRNAPQSLISSPLEAGEDAVLQLERVRIALALPLSETAHRLGVPFPPFYISNRNHSPTVSLSTVLSPLFQASLALHTILEHSSRGYIRSEFKLFLKLSPKLAIPCPNLGPMLAPVRIWSSSCYNMLSDILPPLSYA